MLSIQIIGLVMYAKAHFKFKIARSQHLGIKIRSPLSLGEKNLVCVRVLI